MDEVQKAEEFADVGELDTVAQEIKQQESAAKEEPKSVIEDIIPDEFKGKTVAEIAGIALHARREMGKQANELGEVRRLADELIKSTLHKPAEQEDVSNEVDIFNDPKEAIRREVEANPVVRQAAEYAVQSQRELAKQRLASLHPDFNQIVQDKGFAEWIGKSPIRQQLFQQANDYDVDSAHELFSTYKEIRTSRDNAVSETEKAAREKSMRAASVDTGGSGEKSKKIFRRTDIMKLMTSDPKRYRSMENEIMLAYLEGRVR